MVRCLKHSLSYPFKHDLILLVERVEKVPKYKSNTCQRKNTFP